MNYTEVMAFREDIGMGELLEPDWYIPLDKISAFSQYGDTTTLVYVTGMDAPIKAKGSIQSLVDIFDMKVRAVLND
jgi:hypothetical protein